MTITFLGDVMLDREQLTLYQSNGFDFSKCFSSFKSLFSDSDYIVANLETPVAGKKFGFTNEAYCFNAPVEFAEALKDGGVNLVTTANNHCLDRGVQGLKSTIENLDNIGLEHIGTHKKPESSFFIKEIDGIKVGFVSFTYGTNAFANGVYLKKSERHLVDMFQNQELHNSFVRTMYKSDAFIFKAIRFVFRRFGMFQLGKPVYERTESSLWHIMQYKKSIRECKKAGAEYVVSLLHTGGQYNSKPTELTKRICKKSFASGADVVIANHEHVIHGYTRQFRTLGKFCFYSLGNCLSSAGVTKEPFDKFAQYSAAVNIKILWGGVQECSVKILTSVLLPDGKIVVRSLFDEIENCPDSKKKERLVADNNAVLNTIFSTDGKKYPILREYRLD